MIVCGYMPSFNSQNLKCKIEDLKKKNVFVPKPKNYIENFEACGCHLYIISNFRVQYMT